MGLIALFVMDVNSGTDPSVDLTAVIKDGTGVYGEPSVLPIKSFETELGPDYSPSSGGEFGSVELAQDRLGAPAGSTAIPGAFRVGNPA